MADAADVAVAKEKAEKGVLSEKEINEFREIFNLVDTDKGGSISITEYA